MSQRKEKYARNTERRTGALEDRAEKIEGRLDSYGVRLFKIEADMAHTRAMHYNEMDVRRQGEVHTAQENRRQRREIEWDMDRQRRGLVIAMVLAIVALIVAVHAAGTERETENDQAGRLQGRRSILCTVLAPPGAAGGEKAVAPPARHPCFSGY